MKAVFEFVASVPGMAINRSIEVFQRVLAKVLPIGVPGNLKLLVGPRLCRSLKGLKNRAEGIADASNRNQQLTKALPKCRV